MRTSSCWLIALLAVLFSAPPSRAEEETLGPFAEGRTQVAVHLTMRVFEMPLGMADQFVRTPASGKSSRVRSIGSKAARILETAARRRRDIRVREHVRTTALMEQSVILKDLQKETYVQDYDVEFGTDGSYIAYPIIGTIIAGVTLEAKTRLRKKDMLLTLEGAWGALIRPIPVFKPLVGRHEDTPLQIQLPEMRVTQVKEELAFRGTGRWILRSRVMHVDPDTNRDSARIVLIHAKRTTHVQPELDADLTGQPAPMPMK